MSQLVTYTCIDGYDTTIEPKFMAAVDKWLDVVAIKRPRCLLCDFQWENLSPPYPAGWVFGQVVEEPPKWPIEMEVWAVCPLCWEHDDIHRRIEDAIDHEQGRVR